MEADEPAAAAPAADEAEASTEPALEFTDADGEDTLSADAPPVLQDIPPAEIEAALVNMAVRLLWREEPGASAAVS